MAMPDDDDDEAVIVKKQVQTVSGTAWWLVVSVAIVILMLYAEAPWWLVAIVAAETYASGRRMIMAYYAPSASDSSSLDEVLPPRRQRRLRHFTSLKLNPEAPLDEIVARFTSLDSLKTVRSVELGSNSSTEDRSRGHTLGLMATFAGTAERDAFLKSMERAAFNAFIEPHVAESFVFDFESGMV
jgi:hypothetical protein